MQDTAKLIPLDYVYYGHLLMKNAQDSLGIIELKKAVDRDSTRYDLYEEIARTYSKLKKHQDAIDSYHELMKRSNGYMVNLDYQIGKEYYMMAEDNTTPGDTAIQNLNYRQADTSFTKVTQLSPDSYLGFLWKGRALSKLDPETNKGLAKPSYDSAMVLLQKGDTLKNQKQLMECYRYLAFYYYVQADNLKLSKQLAESDTAMNNSINYWSKILEMNPADEQAKTALDNLKKK